MSTESFVATMIAGGIGAYIGSYLKKKGEHLATKEDFESLVAQMKQMTEATKTIEATISDKVWNRQKQWEIKRDALFVVAEAYQEADDKFISMLAKYKAAQLANQVADSREPKLFQARQDCLDAMARFVIKGSVASLVCAPKTGEAMNQASTAMRTGFANLKDDEDNHQYLPKVRETGYALMTAIRADLGVDTPTS